MTQLFSFAGYYAGAGDHYTHQACRPGNNNVCGIDLHDDKGENLVPIFNNTEYSAYQFGKRAVQIVQQHDQSKVKHCNSSLVSSEQQMTAQMIPCICTGVNHADSELFTKEC